MSASNRDGTREKTEVAREEREKDYQVKKDPDIRSATKHRREAEGRW